MKNKRYAISKEDFYQLPGGVQDKARNILKAYDEVNIIFEYGEYRVSAGLALTATYAPDHKFIGVAYAEDIFTEEERIINYAESFHEFPSNYKGKRDYRMMNSIGHDWSVRFKLENGNLVIA